MIHQLPAPVTVDKVTLFTQWVRSENGFMLLTHLLSLAKKYIISCRNPQSKFLYGQLFVKPFCLSVIGAQTFFNRAIKLLYCAALEAAHCLWRSYVQLAQFPIPVT